jgi:ribosome maturation protein SDO1
VNEVLQTDKIFKNAIKGDLAKKEDLNHFFPNMEYNDIVKLILEKGDIQISEKERNLNQYNTKNDIANIIVEKTFNSENGLPFPHSMIVQVLDDIKFTTRDDQDTKKQALKAIKCIQEKNILPIERKLMSFNLYLKEKNPLKDDKDFNEFTTKIITFLDKIGAFYVEKNIEKIKTFKISCKIYPNHYRDLINNFEDGILMILIFIKLN